MVVEMKFSVNGMNNRVDIAEGKICSLKIRAVHKDEEPEIQRKIKKHEA